MTGSYTWYQFELTIHGFMSYHSKAILRTCDDIEGIQSRDLNPDFPSRQLAWVTMQCNEHGHSTILQTREMEGCAPHSPHQLDSTSSFAYQG